MLRLALDFKSTFFQFYYSKFKRNRKKTEVLKVRYCLKILLTIFNPNKLMHSRKQAVPMDSLRAKEKQKTGLTKLDFHNNVVG